MKLLLDTHTFIWFIEGNSKLSNKVKVLIESSDNQCFLSVASLWEMTIKKSIGKLELGMDMQTLIDEHIHQNAIEILPVNTSAFFIFQVILLSVCGSGFIVVRGYGLFFWVRICLI